jgi:C-terminal processing protease CtpA/Prc
MRTLICRSHLSLLFLTLFLSVAASAACVTPRCLGFQSDLDYFVNKGVENYCYWEVKTKDTGHDYRKIADDLKTRISDDTSMTEFNTIMRTWAASFHDGHVNFILGARGEPIQMAAADVRFELIAPGTEQEVLIVAKTSWHLGLKVGDVVTHVGSLTAKEAIDRAVMTQSGSTPRMRRYFAAKRIIEVMAPIDGVEQKIDIVIADSAHAGAGKTVSVPFRMVAFPNTDTYTAVTSPVSSKILENNIGYLKISRFIDSESGIIEAMANLADTESLIIDVRGNGGGDQSGDEVLNRLIQKEITRYSVSARMSDDVKSERVEFNDEALISGTDFTVWKPRLVAPSANTPYLNKQIVTLIDSGCFSACDTFVSALKTNQLSTIIGLGSGGGTGTPLMGRLPYSNHGFRYSVIRGVSADGLPIEGVGTLPHLVSMPTVEDRILGIDSPMVLAIQYLTAATPAYRHVEPQSLAVHPLAQEQSDFFSGCNDLLH